MGNFVLYCYIDGEKNYFMGRNPKYHWSGGWTTAISRAQYYTSRTAAESMAYRIAPDVHDVHVEFVG